MRTRDGDPPPYEIWAFALPNAVARRGSRTGSALAEMHIGSKTSVCRGPGRQGCGTMRDPNPLKSIASSWIGLCPPGCCACHYDISQDLCTRPPLGSCSPCPHASGSCSSNSTEICVRAAVTCVRQLRQGLASEEILGPYRTTRRLTEPSVDICRSQLKHPCRGSRR